MKKDDKASISLKKVISISIILLFLMGIVVMAASSSLNNVKIILSDGYEMDVLTSKTNISEILEENHIILLPTEEVIPGLDEQISDNNTIRISNNATESNKTEEVVSEELSMEKILGEYSSVTEKIIKEQEEIPYETETRDISTGSDNKEEVVIQSGSNGLKEITYKAKYENDQEIEKIQIAEEVIEEPENCIKEIRNKRVVVVTSRSSSSISEDDGGSERASGGSTADYQAFAEQRCYDYGWSQYDFECLVKLWNRESGWNPNSHNRSSGAHGIPQALPASKMAAYGSDYYTNGYVQINWGLDYIAGRYGSPSNAWSSFCSKGWY